MPKTDATESKPNPAGKLLASDPYSRSFVERWKQNRCTQLLGFACLIFAVGVAFLLYRQNRFVPVEFPTGDLIPDPGGLPAGNEAIPAEAASMVIVGAQNDRGALRVAVYDAAEGFKDRANAIYLETLQIRNGEAVAWVPVDTLPKSFAIAVFHDENENGELDRNRFGIPTERYGFSNDARGLTGPPSFEDAKIDCPKAGQSIRISIR